MQVHQLSSQNCVRPVRKHVSDTFQGCTQSVHKIAQRIPSSQTASLRNKAPFRFRSYINKQLVSGLWLICGSTAAVILASPTAAFFCSPFQSSANQRPSRMQRWPSSPHKGRYKHPAGRCYLLPLMALETHAASPPPLTLQSRSLPCKRISQPQKMPLHNMSNNSTIKPKLACTSHNAAPQHCAHAHTHPCLPSGTLQMQHYPLPSRRRVFACVKLAANLSSF